MAVAALALATGGCKFLAYALAPPRTETIKAQCDELNNTSVAIMVFVPPEVMSDYPYAQDQLTRVLAARFRNDSAAGLLKNLRVLDPVAVRQFQERTINWNGMPRTEIAKELGVEYLLLVQIMEFSTREDADSFDLYRGRLTATAALYDAQRPESRASIWPVSGRHDSIFAIVHPEAGPVGLVSGHNDSVVRDPMLLRFADLLSRKFYTHKVTHTNDDPKNSRS